MKHKNTQKLTLLTLKDLSVLDGLLPGLSKASRSLEIGRAHV